MTNLGAEKLTDWVEEQFYLLVDYRYRQRLPVLASSNCRKEMLAQRLDRRVLDRLRETCAMVEVVGPNLRDRRCSAGNLAEATMERVIDSGGVRHLQSAVSLPGCNRTICQR